MRFMIMVIPKGYESAAPNAVPTAEAVAKMMAYNKAPQKAALSFETRLSPSTPELSIRKSRPSGLYHGNGAIVTSPIRT